MNYCIAKRVNDEAGKSWYVVFESASLGLLREPTKYLKHKTNCNCSPNTIQRIAYALAYYYSFLHELGILPEEVLRMKYSEQHDHFVEFLYWLKSGSHTDRNKEPNNKTCNSYLQSVFGFYEFLLLEDGSLGDVKVLEAREMNYSSSVGVRFQRSVKHFRGYLPEEESVGRTITKDKILTLIEASDSIRNILMILLLAETGFRIGELLGVKYSEDIDYDIHTIKVTARDDNPNGARSKYAEIRHAKISEGTYEVLMYYLSENSRLLKQTEYLFINLYGPNRGRPMTESAVNSALRVLEKRTGIAATPHMLRHYFANERRKAGWTIEQIQKALGQKHISTTMRYINIEEEEMADVMDLYYKKHDSLYDIQKII